MKIQAKKRSQQYKWRRMLSYKCSFQLSSKRRTEGKCHPSPSMRKPTICTVSNVGLNRRPKNTDMRTEVGSEVVVRTSGTKAAFLPYWSWGQFHPFQGDFPCACDMLASWPQLTPTL